MKVFVTGASGYVGRHVARELLSRGHQVFGLSRSPSERTTSLPDVQWCFGGLDSPDSYKEVLGASDAVVHCAMDYSSTGENSELDMGFVNCMEGYTGQFVYTGNLFSNRSHGKLEEAPESGSDHWRFLSEVAALDRPGPASVIRLGFVYGGRGGHFWDIVSPGALAGLTSHDVPDVWWPMIHVQDVASLYATVLETKGEGVFHAWDGRPTLAREVIDTTRSLYESLGFSDNESNGYITGLLRSSVPTSNRRSLSIGWVPTCAGFPDCIGRAYAEHTSWST